MKHSFQVKKNKHHFLQKKKKKKKKQARYSFEDNVWMRKKEQPHDRENFKLKGRSTL